VQIFCSKIQVFQKVIFLLQFNKCAYIKSHAMYIAEKLAYLSLREFFTKWLVGRGGGGVGGSSLS
jgi:hypothetical protein